MMVNSIGTAPSLCPMTHSSLSLADPQWWVSLYSPLCWVVQSLILILPVGEMQRPNRRQAAAHSERRQVSCLVSPSPTIILCLAMTDARCSIVGYFDTMAQRWEYSSRFAVYGTRFVLRDRSPAIPNQNQNQNQHPHPHAHDPYAKKPGMPPLPPTPTHPHRQHYKSSEPCTSLSPLLVYLASILRPRIWDLHPDQRSRFNIGSTPVANIPQPSVLVNPLSVALPDPPSLHLHTQRTTHMTDPRPGPKTPRFTLPSITTVCDLLIYGNDRHDVCTPWVS